MKEPKQYIDPKAKFYPVQLTDLEYGRAIQTLIVVCVDVIFFVPNSRKVFLLKRKAQPLVGWWLIGGRLHSGEEPRAGLSRKIREEIGINIDPERMKFISMNRYVMDGRAQVPTDIGADSLAFTYAVSSSESDLSEARIDPMEYDQEIGFRLFSREELIALGCRQALVEVYDEIFTDKLAGEDDIQVKQRNI